MEQPVKHGQSLLDQVDSFTDVFDTQLGLLADLRDLYCDRAALEREYAIKLELLARKVTEKRLKIAAPLVVGNSPRKSDTIKQNTLDHAFVQITSTLSNTAQDHVALANKLATEIVKPLGALGCRGEDHKKKQTQFYQKLLLERDHYYQDCVTKKRKVCQVMVPLVLRDYVSQYYDDCAKVETCQKKDRSSDSAVREYEQKRSDMLASKNMYLVAIAVANSVKGKFYKEDIPNFENIYSQHIIISLMTLTWTFRGLANLPC